MNGLLLGAKEAHYSFIASAPWV